MAGLAQDWDVVVAGAGPAGSSTALKAAQAGWRVLMLDKRKCVGVPVQCAEYVPYQLIREIGAPETVVAQRVGTLRTYVEGKPAAENSWPGVLLHRDRFDQHLAARATEAGATLLTGCRVEAVQDGLVLFRANGGLRRVRARVIAGADGPLSAVGAALGIRNGSFLYCAQAEAPLAAPMDHTEAHFRPEFAGGYAWVFPKGGTANIGIGVERSAAPSLPGLLRALLAELRDRGVVANGPVRKRCGGLVPAGGPPPRTVQGDAVLVGDAAGQTDAITGSGIPAAVRCGLIAGESICEALAAGNSGLLSRYEEEWRDLLGRPLARAAGRRKTQLLNWNRGPFENLVRSTWIAFPEYYGAH